MDQRTTYEIIIEGKLQALPIPDMADQIWSRIQGQLDIDMPNDDDTPGQGGPGGGSPVIRGLGWGALIFIGALITLFFLGRDNNDVLPASMETIEPVKTEEAVPGKQPPSLPGNFIKSTIDKPPGSSSGTPIVIADSPSSVETTPVKIDSNNLVQQPPITENHLPVQIVPKPDTTVKKKRGITGINDSDYKIVPKNGQ